MTYDLYYRKMESTSTTDLVDMIRERDERIAELEAQIEKMKCCCNCNNFDEERKLCIYSMGDEGYFCRLRQWELRND